VRGDLAQGGLPIVAGSATANHAWRDRIMIEYDTAGKGGGVLMAYIALRSSNDMTAGFGLDPGGDAMARIATTSRGWAGRSMIEHCACKRSRRCMADLALGCGWYMCRRFSLGGRAIVACVASCDSQLVIECRAGFEITRGAMTGFA